MAGFLGCETPIFDIAQHLKPGDKKDMLVRSTHTGAALAKYFEPSGDSAETRSVVLMRGHGFSVQGSSILDAVMRAVYTQQNAVIQTTALTTRAAHLLSSGNASASQSGANLAEMAYLSAEECEDAAGMTKWSVGRPWRLWLREVEANGLYVNQA